MIKNYCVSINVTEQVSEDSWKVKTKTLKVDSNTTIGEIEQWYRKYFQVATTEFLTTELETTP